MHDGKRKDCFQKCTYMKLRLQTAKIQQAAQNDPPTCIWVYTVCPRAQIRWGIENSTTKKITSRRDGSNDGSQHTFRRSHVENFT